MKKIYLKSIRGKLLTKLMVAFALIVAFGFTSNAQTWVVYDASVVPADAGFDANSSNTENGTELISILDDTENEGNKLLSYASGVADKFTWKAPKFSDAYVAGGGFTIMMRAKSISSDVKGVIEFELKNGEVREKLRIHTNSVINFEKSGKLDVDFPEGIDALDFCIYRIVFDGGMAKVWMNETYMGEGLVSETSNSDDPRFVIGDSNGSSDYGSLVDWIIWDETGAYAPGEGAEIPDSLLTPELVEPRDAAWTVYDASVLLGDAGFDPSDSGTELIVDDTENAGNKLLSYASSVEGKFRWKAPKFSDAYVAGGGFTIMMRAKAISDTTKGVIEFELKNGVVREKLRIHTNSSINFEKSDKLDVDFPEGIDALNFCIYRIVFDGGKAKVWMNETYMGEGLVSTTDNDDDPRFVVGDSNGSSDYASIVDWIIWDETGAYAPGEGAALPDSLVQTELEEAPVADWTIYDASVVPAEAGFSEGSSQTMNGTEMVEILSVEGNGILKISSAKEDKNYWQAPTFSDMFDNAEGFTVMVRAAAMSEEYGRMTEIEMKGAGFREKVRISSDGIINLEKASIDFNFPSQFTVTGYNVYRITFKENHTMVWVNDVFVGEGTTSSTSSSSPRWVFGDSSSGMSYGAYIDWAIWDETKAHTNDNSPSLPEGLDGSFTSDVETSVNSISISKDLLVYPNPAFDHIYVKGNDIMSLEVYNLYGQQVISERNTNKLSLENITSGMYLIKSINSKGEISLGQFIKK